MMMIIIVIIDDYYYYIRFGFIDNFTVRRSKRGTC